MGSSEYTVCDEVTVVAWDAERGPILEVSFPDDQWDRTTYRKPFATLDDAKAAGKALAAGLKPLRPKGLTGFYGSARLNLKHAETVEARAAIEAAVRQWAGNDCEVESVNA